MRQQNLSQMTKAATSILTVILAWAWLGAYAAQGQIIPDRRKDQFPTEPAYLIVPFPYSLAGIGDGIAWTGMMSNIAETNIDAFALLITGDAEGSWVSLEDIHLIPETLIIEASRQAINKAVVNFYDKRGMNTEKDDFTLVELSKAETTTATMTLSLFDRQLELFAAKMKQDTEVPRVRNAEGDILYELSPPYTDTSESTTIGVVFDFTDDRQDPRKGLRMGVQKSNTPPDTSEDPDFFVWEYFVTGYIPFGASSTLALHYFQSDAEVTREGQTDPTQVGLKNFGCDYTTTCTTDQKNVIDQFVAGNKYGTATSLGGDIRLRSYPGGRFQGAHAIHYAAEFRWNMSEETTPFDYFIWKDVRTGMQVAFFAETGSVADTKGELGDKFASSYGVGFRLVSASGNVYRADLATGEEGTEPTLIFFYPW